MPVYTVATEMGRLDADQREKLAVGITDIHGEETGAPEPLIHVIFTGFPPGMAYTSRRLGSPIIVNASIRAGRPESVRQRMLTRISSLVTEVLQVPEHDVLVALFDFPPHWAMEAGLVLPPTEPQAEAKWLADFEAKTLATQS